MRGIGHARGHMRVDQIGHAVVRHQAVAGRQVDALLPFRRADGRLHFGVDVCHAHGVL
ncbi:hypothetical protein D3C78_1878240 [compost metagenome]